LIEDQEELEKQVQRNRETEDALHRNFRPRDTQTTQEGQTEQEQAEAKKELQHQEGLAAKRQGDIGEGVTLRVATERLGLTPDPRFDQTERGLDGVYRDGQGRLVVVESKFGEKGIRALEGNQMQPEWLERNAKMMQTPGNERYTPGNAEIGAELEKQGVDKGRRLVVTTDPRDLVVRVYEGQTDHSWKQIDTWNAWDLEQPYLKD